MRYILFRRHQKIADILAESYSLMNEQRWLICESVPINGLFHSRRSKLSIAYTSFIFSTRTHTHTRTSALEKHTKLLSSLYHVIIELRGFEQQAGFICIKYLSLNQTNDSLRVCCLRRLEPECSRDLLWDESLLKSLLYEHPLIFSRVRFIYSLSSLAIFCHLLLINFRGSHGNKS
jgi:hypothetical protein